jgi:hypothetical protein
MLLAALARGRTRRSALLASGVAAATAAVWLPVALSQPRASMAWAEGRPLAERAAQFATNLVLGVPVDPGPARLLGPFAILLLAAAFLTRWARARIPLAGPFSVGLVLLLPLLSFSSSALLPERTALLFLPFVVLLLAEALPVLPAAAGPAAATVLAASIPGWLRPTPSSQLAETLAPGVRAGSHVVAAELWGPELDYRLEREGLAGRVTFFPSEVARHPGWYEESGVVPERLVEEAAAALRRSGPRTFFVFSSATRAGRILRAELSARKATRVADAGVFEIWTTSCCPPPDPATGGR